MTAVISIDRARQALGIGAGDTRQRDVLTAAVTAVSQALDELCGPIVQRTVTEIIDTDGCEDDIQLSAAPVASITSVTIYRAGVPTVLTAETLTTAGGYLAEPQERIAPGGTTQFLSGEVCRRSNFADMAWELGRVQVVYVAGRYADTAACAGSRFEMAAMVTLKSMWRAFDRQTTVADGEFAVPFESFPGFAIPRAALELVAADRVHIVGIA